jgi:hypothetical protein
MHCSGQVQGINLILSKSLFLFFLFFKLELFLSQLIVLGCIIQDLEFEESCHLNCGVDLLLKVDFAIQLSMKQDHSDLALEITGHLNSLDCLS